MLDKVEHEEIKEKIEKTDGIINEAVFGLYGIHEEEIKMIKEVI